MICAHGDHRETRTAGQQVLGVAITCSRYLAAPSIAKPEFVSKTKALLTGFSFSPPASRPEQQRPTGGTNAGVLLENLAVPGAVLPPAAGRVPRLLRSGVDIWMLRPEDPYDAGLELGKPRQNHAKTVAKAVQP